MPESELFPSQGPVAGATRAQRVAFGVLGLGLLLLGLWTLRGFLPALVWAVVLAIAVWPLYRRAGGGQAGGMDRRLGLPALFTLAVALLFIVPLAISLVQLSREMHAIIQWLDHARDAGIPVPDWLQRLPGGGQLAGWWQANLSDPQAGQHLLGRIDRGGLLAWTREIGSSLLHRLVLFGFTLLTLFFLFRDGAALSDGLRAASQRAFGPRGERVGLQIVASVHGTVDGLVLVGLGEGLLMGIAYFVAEVPHPALLGAATAVAAMLPFAAVAVIGGVALVLLAQGSVGWAIGLFGFGMAVVFVADHFVRPVLIGGATRLPFLFVLLGILGGLETFGLLGLFIGPAVMAALVLLWRDWTHPELV